MIAPTKWVLDYFQRYFSSYASYISYEYDAMFSGQLDGVCSEFLESFSQCLGIANCFTNKSSYRKQSYLPLESTIANFDEVQKALKGTRFEYCLHDETLYRLQKLGSQSVSVANAPPRVSLSPAVIAASGPTARIPVKSGGRR